jgi:lipopolysaccharide/colanic/teichoic acid biosynthesis glycosyltransferase
MYGKFEEKALTRSLMQKQVATELITRFCECAVVAIALLLLAPLMLVCAAAVWVSSPGPIVFRQKRMGRNGEPFTLFKFRTMTAASAGLLVTAGNDRRITRVGRILRRSKLDELPEFYNVLRGDMSLVGPRPEVVELVDLSDPAWHRVLKHRPGITDPVTLQLRNEELLLAGVDDKARFYSEVVPPFKLRGYLKYLDARSPTGDLKIVFLTIKVVLFPELAESLRISDLCTEPTAAGFDSLSDGPARSVTAMSQRKVQQLS